MINGINKSPLCLTFFKALNERFTMDSDVEIAIVGVGCKFPGADNLDEYWKVGSTNI